MTAPTPDTIRPGAMLDVKPFTLRALTRNPSGQMVVCWLPGGTWTVRGACDLAPSRVTGPDAVPALVVDRAAPLPYELSWYVSPAALDAA